MTILEQQLECRILLETWGLYTVMDGAGLILNVCFLPGNAKELSSILMCVSDTGHYHELPPDYAIKMTGVASVNLALSFLHYEHAHRIERIHRSRFGAIVSEEVVQTWDKQARAPKPGDEEMRRKRRLFHMASGDVVCDDLTRFYDY